MIGFIANVEFVWGFQSKIVGYSKTSPSFHYPPPTTILGALAESIAREYNIGENKGRELIPKLAQNLLALGIKPVNCIPVKFSDINRIIATKLAGGIRYPSPRDIYGSFDAPAIGKTLMTPIDGKTPQLTIYVVFKNQTITFEKLEINITKNHFWNIHRIGTKESSVSTMNVEEFEPEVSKVSSVETEYSFPLINGVQEDEEVYKKWIDEVLINPFRIRAYNEDENPVKNYIMGQNIIRYKLPIIQLQNIKPLYRVRLDTSVCCVYVRDNEKLVGLCQR